MITLKTKKQRDYFYQVIKLHYEFGYGEDKISRMLPVGHTTANRWIAIFAAEQNKKDESMKDVVNNEGHKQPQANITANQQNESPDADNLTPEALKAQIKELERKLKFAELKADAYDEMINVAEEMFNIPIRKKAGAKP